MNEQQALDLFRKNDDPVHSVYPPGFDHGAARSRFQRFAAALDSATGVSHATETGSYIQDASFHSQIDLGSGWLRFSNFGDLVAITPDHEVDAETLDCVRRLCRERRYVFVPTELTELPYTGENPGVTGIRDWWIRYFDWI